MPNLLESISCRACFGASPTLRIPFVPGGASSAARTPGESGVAISAARIPIAPLDGKAKPMAPSTRRLDADRVVVLACVVALLVALLLI